MRRRNRDVFELGQEQLLDEPAVELVEPEGPPVPPPAAGSASEATGPEESRAEPAEAARTLPRVPSLDGLLRRRRVVATALSLLAIGAAALVGVRQALEGGSESAPVAAPTRADSAPVRARATASGGRDDPDGARRPRGDVAGKASQAPGSGAALDAGSGNDQAVGTDVAAPYAPESDAGAGSGDAAGASPGEAASEPTPELVAREFGL